MSLMMPFAYPAGIAPGFNPNHLMAKNAQISAVALPSVISGHAPTPVVDLLTGLYAIEQNVGGLVGTHGVIGPYTQAFDASNLMAFTQTRIPRLNPPNPLTVGIIFVPSSTSAGQLWSVGNGSTGWRIDSSTVIALVSNGVVNTGNSFTIVANMPYFLAMSANATKVNSVLVNLLTGQTFTDTKTPSGNTAGSLIGSDMFKMSSAANRLSAAAMSSNAFHSLSELLQWAQDPWSFWYPDYFGIYNLSGLAVA